VSNFPFGSSVSHPYTSQIHPAHVCPLSGPGTRPGIRPVIQDDQRRNWPSVSWFPVAFRRTGIRLLSRPDPLRNSTSLTVGLPTSTINGWTSTGFPRSPRMRTDRGGCLLYPGAVVSPRPEINLPPGTRCFPTASPTPPSPSFIPGGSQSRGINEGSRDSPVRSSFRPYPPG
jgi:hypothetical protein